MPTALGAVSGGNASASKDQRQDVAAGSSRGAWVGVVRVSHSRDVARDGASYHIQGSLNVTPRANRTARATGSNRVRNENPNSARPDCPDIFSYQGSFVGPVSPPRVSIVPPKYRVDYSSSGGVMLIDVAIQEQKYSQGQCRKDSRFDQRRLLEPYIPIEGRATPKTTRVAGSLSFHNRHCTNEPNCKETENATWDLHLADAVGGKSSRRRWRREWRRQGRPPVARRVPGAGCERNVISGTALDDQLTGTKRADLMLGLAGNDLVRGRGGSDCQFGAPGDDVLLGKAGNDLLAGDAGNDILEGGGGNDLLMGGPGRNELSGGKGNDLIRARNGQRDVIGCGPSHDVVVADREDKVAKDCEVGL